MRLAGPPFPVLMALALLPLAACRTADDSPSGGRPGKPGAASASAEVPLCPDGWRPLLVNAAVAGRRLAITLTCKRDADAETRPAVASIPLSGGGGGAPASIALEPLFAPATSGMQRVELTDSGRYAIRLTASGGPCPALVAEALRTPPVPARYLDRYRRWNLSIDFLATPDCSVILAYIGNRAVAIEPRTRGSAKLYDIRIGF